MNIFTDWKIAVFGLASWAVPFVVSFAFFGPDGELVVPQPLFKSLMVVVFGGLGALLMVYAFRGQRPTIASGLILGLYWLLLNLALDLLILIPMTGMGVADYLADIGLRYLLIPIMAVAMGAVAERAAKN